MRLDEFAYHLPGQLIAQEPLRQRDQARLMVLRRRDGTITHDRFCNLGKYLEPKSVLVLNNSKVIPARMLGTKERSGGKVEVFFLRALSDGYSFEALLMPLSRLRDGDRIVFNSGSVRAVIKDREKGIVAFDKKNVLRQLTRIGHVPLPPYIHRTDGAQDQEYYQTVYAREPGSVAAPTAGLHFTKELLGRLKNLDHSIEQVMLHVNFATFKPVVEEDIARHEMHHEAYAVALQVWRRIKSAKKGGRAIVAVGTTSCRVLEAVAASGTLSGETNLFIYPGYRFQVPDALLTNFHLPYSTLLMLVYAFGGTQFLRRAYQEAIKEKYRFYSYGDAMLIL